MTRKAPGKDETKRHHLNYRGPQNYLFPFNKYSVLDWFNLFIKFRSKRRKQFYNHISAEKVKNMIDPNIWNKYYKFCFERNPWDRVISQYFWRLNKPREDMKYFLKSRHFNDLIKKGRKIYTINNEIVVDRIYKFEELNNAINDLSIKLKLPGPLKLPNTKSTTRPDKIHYNDILNSNEKKYIEKVFQKEIINLDYQS